MIRKQLEWRTFTLLELLITIAVIAILTGLLLPALHRAKEKAQAAECLNHLKQLGVCVSFYSSDYSGFFPGIGPTLPNYRMPKSWRMTLGEYLGGTNASYGKVFLCAGAPADPDHTDTYESNESVKTNSYGMNKSLALQRVEKLKNSSRKMCGTRNCPAEKRISVMSRITGTGTSAAVTGTDATSSGRICTHPMR